MSTSSNSVQIGLLLNITVQNNIMTGPGAWPVSNNVRLLKRFPDLHNFPSALVSKLGQADQISRTNEAASGDNLDGPISYFASTQI